MSKPPELNQRVVVRTTVLEAELTSRVEDVAPTRILIAMPSDGTYTHDLPAGTHVELQWIAKRGLGLATGTVAGREISSVPCLQIDLHDAQVVQRRDDVRVEVNVEVHVWPDDEDAPPTAATSLDMSGGGMRLRIAGDWPMGSVVHVRIGIPEDEPIEAAGRIVRIIEDEEKGPTYGVRFEDIDDGDRDRLIRFVFARMRGQAMTRGAV